MQLHAWLLRVGTADAARQAVELWEGQVLQGRTHSDISEALSAAKLALARCLLRQAAGATPPAVSVKPGKDAAAAADTDAPDSKQGRHKHGSKSYAKAAGPAQAAPAPQLAALPTASLVGLHQRMQEQPDSQELGEMVSEAVRALGDAQHGFITTNQPAGMLEALSWSLAAKPDVEITVAQWQLKDADSWGGSRLCDVLEVVGHTQQAVQLLQALETAISDTKSERECKRRQEAVAVLVRWQYRGAGGAASATSAHTHKHRMWCCVVLRLVGCCCCCVKRHAWDATLSNP